MFSVEICLSPNEGGKGEQLISPQAVTCRRESPPEPKDSSGPCGLQVCSFAACGPGNKGSSQAKSLLCLSLPLSVTQSSLGSPGLCHLQQPGEAHSRCGFLLPTKCSLSSENQLRAPGPRHPLSVHLVGGELSRAFKFE